VAPESREGTVISKWNFREDSTIVQRNVPRRSYPVTEE
jgi:hypothetical protein